MESINVLKGYGKVNSSNLETQTTIHSPTNRKSFIVTAAISAAIILNVVISLIVAAAIFDFDFGTESDAAESIRSVCNVTRFPDSCFATISSMNPSVKPDPEAIFKVSIEVSINELKNVSSQFRTLNNNQDEAAVDDCLTQFDDALSKLNDSLAIMAAGSGEKALTENKINDVQTWISAAMTYQQTCLDGLEEMESTVPEAIKEQLEKSNEVLSNSLAIVAKMDTLVHQFHH